MEFLEKDLEDIIFNTSSVNLQKRGLNVCGKRFRQLRIGNYGIADMVTIQHYLGNEMEERLVTITIYEFKKNKIDINTLAQAGRYAKGIKIYIEKFERFQWVNIEYKIVLVGKSLEYNGDFLYLCDFIQNDLELYTYDYDFDGIHFINQYGFTLVKDGF